ncbi:Pyruvate/Phosphoenolpyruvate kinase-like domain-containing protein [Aspergillus pseudodeflectus]|uniref:Pyruvate/Phosphoenolpyruvate kinase-like domain-containing protein n=1 Tax=Aspergillus pseudodeflectus TaxID=176178 RepID=A0ABR4KF90_9EURO
MFEQHTNLNRDAASFEERCQHTDDLCKRLEGLKDCQLTAQREKHREVNGPEHQGPCVRDKRAHCFGVLVPIAGTRGAGAIFALSAFNMSSRGYLATVIEWVVAIVQIESLKAVGNCEEIAAVDGVDMLFVGPNDLAISMGYVALDSNHGSIGEVLMAIARVLKAAKDAGKYAGHFCVGAEEVARRWKRV